MDVPAPAQMGAALMVALMAGRHRAVIVRVIALIIAPIIVMPALKGPLAVSAQKQASAAITTPQPFANAMPVAAQEAAKPVVQDGPVQDAIAQDVTIQNGGLITMVKPAAMWRAAVIIVQRAAGIIGAASHLAMPRAAMASNAPHVRMVKASAAASPVVNQAAIAISNHAPAAMPLAAIGPVAAKPAVKLEAKTSKSAAPAAR